MKTDSWMPLWIGDYLADTSRLNTTQHGAYLLLIMDYWRNGPPPDNDAILARITIATPEEWLQLRPTIEPFFQLNNGTWHHKRIDSELQSANARYSSRCNQTLAARNARISRISSKSSVTDNATMSVVSPLTHPTTPPPDILHKTIPSNHSKFSVTENVTNPVTTNVTSPVTSVQSQSQSQSPGVQGVQGGFSKNLSPSVQCIKDQQELKRIETRLEIIRNHATVTANEKSFSPTQLLELASLKTRRQQLLSSLGFQT